MNRHLKLRITGRPGRNKLETPSPECIGSTNDNEPDIEKQMEQGGHDCSWQLDPFESLKLLDRSKSDS